MVARFRAPFVSSGWFWIMGAGLVGPACAPTPAEYAGSQMDVVARPDQIRDLERAPQGAEALGEVTSHCQLDGLGYDAEKGRTAVRQRDTQERRLSSLLCSPRLLTQVMMEAAAEVGGTALVGRSCVGGATENGAPLRCRAFVVREQSPEPGPSGWMKWPNGVPRLTRPSDAFRISIEFSPRDAYAPRASRPAHLVSEQTYVPPADVEFGDLSASCDEDCGVDSVREALRLAAASLGADDIARIACVELGEARQCTGVAAALEVDPRVDPAAR